VRTDGVEVPPPPLDQDLGLPEIVEELDVEKLGFR
jgi:hypothetical protein